MDTSSESVNAMNEYWGVECDDFAPGCPVCQAWQLFRRNYRMPTDVEVWDAVNVYNKD